VTWVQRRFTSLEYPGQWLIHRLPTEFRMGPGETESCGMNLNPAQLSLIRAERGEQGSSLIASEAVYSDSLGRGFEPHPPHQSHQVGHACPGPVAGQTCHAPRMVMDRLLRRGTGEQEALRHRHQVAREDVGLAARPETRSVGDPEHHGREHHGEGELQVVVGRGGGGAGPARP
jgi:hypothetical protein